MKKINGTRMKLSLLIYNTEIDEILFRPIHTDDVSTIIEKEGLFSQKLTNNNENIYKIGL